MIGCKVEELSKPERFTWARNRVEPAADAKTSGTPDSVRRPALTANEVGPKAK